METEVVTATTNLALTAYLLVIAKSSYSFVGHYETRIFHKKIDRKQFCLKLEIICLRSGKINCRESRFSGDLCI